MCLIHPYSPYYYGYGRRRVAWILTVLFIVVAAIAISAFLSIHYSSSADSNDLDTAKEYALTDKVIRSYNRDFCQGLEAVSTDAPVDVFQQSNATLYLLSSRPLLTDNEHFNLTQRISLDSITNYHAWNFYLNAGSNVSFNVCYPLESRSGNYDAKFYLIKGTKNHNKWAANPDQSYAEKYTRLLSRCQTISYRVYNDDLYYFVFYLDTSYISLSTVLDVDFHFDRTVYHISPHHVVQRCTIPLDGVSRCSVSVPMSSSYTALLSLNTSLPVDYNDGANVQINCQPRAWLYIVIVLGAALLIVIIIASVVTCVCITVRRRKKAYSSLVDTQSATESTDKLHTSGLPNAAESAFANSSGNYPQTTNPPAYNPSYSPQAGGMYGSTARPPPYSK